MSSQAVPLRTLPVEHMRPEAAYVAGWEDRDRQLAAERVADGLVTPEDRLVAPHARRLDELLARVDAVEPRPHWRPRESEDLLAVASAVGVLRDEAA